MTKKIGRPFGIHTPIKYFNEKERLDSIQRSKTKHMLGTPWFCKVCDRCCMLAAKWCHLKTMKHRRNVAKALNIQVKVTSNGNICYQSFNFYSTH